MTNNVEHLFICLTCLSCTVSVLSGDMFYFQVFCLLFIWIIIDFESSLYILEEVLCHIYDLLILSSSILLFFFIFLRVSLTKFKRFVKPNLLIFSFMVCAFSVLTKNSFPSPRSRRYSCMFSSKSFIALCFSF